MDVIYVYKGCVREDWLLPLGFLFLYFDILMSRVKYRRQPACSMT